MSATPRPRGASLSFSLPFHRSLSPSSSLIHALRTLRSHRVRPISSVQPSKRDRDCDSPACERAECACPRRIDAAAVACVHLRRVRFAVTVVRDASTVKRLARKPA